MILPLLQRIAKPLFGTFETEEFKKFLRMGSIFAIIIGSYWTIRVLKDSVFSSLVCADDLTWAKTASLFALFPLVMVYTKLFDRYSREKMFYILASFYGVASLLFAILIMFTQADSCVIAARSGVALMATKALGYLWYVFVESFGSLVVALFWSFAADTTSPDSAKKGFPLVVAVGQIGGIIAPTLITSITRFFKLQTDALSIFICAGLILSIICLVSNFLKETPKNLLESFHGKNEAKAEGEQEPGFFEGLRLLMSHKYLLGIFSSIFIYEVIVTIFDYNFKVLAASHYTPGPELTQYLATYGSSVNFVALVCLLLGVSNITRILGVGVALALMPIIVGAALFGFLTLDSINFLFALMVGSKAINYALNGPTMKQLYIPTTHDVRFKSQAWIETFGSRGSKQAASSFNMLLKTFKSSMGDVAGKAHYMRISGYLGFSLVACWFVVALFLGRTYQKAVDTKKVVC